MASIVKANPSLTAGGLAVLRRQFSTTDDGTCTYEVDYCCLAQFANNHIGKFKTKAQPPTPIPASMSQLNLRKTPQLYDVSVKTESGLTYFNARYSTASDSEVIITESVEQRSFSAACTGIVRTTVPGSFVTAEQTGTTMVSFDYMSTTVRVDSKNDRAGGGSGRAGRPFNMSIGLISGLVPSIVSGYTQKTIESRSSSRSSNGTYTYSFTSTGIYEATN